MPDREVLLRRGRSLHLRSPTPADSDALGTFVGAVSPTSRYRRFHGLADADAYVPAWVAPDWVERGVLIGERAGAVVAVAEYARLRDVHRAEVAFLVKDELQGEGVGTRLLEQLAAEAYPRGIDVFQAVVMPADVQMLQVFEDAGFSYARTDAGGEVELELMIEPTEEYLRRRDNRDHVAVHASLRAFFAPRSVAVIGASARLGAIGGAVLRNIVDGGFAGDVVAINRTGAPVCGVEAHRTLAELGAPVDLAVVCVPAVNVQAAVDDALAAGTRAICVISSGFSELGDGGVELQARLLAQIRSAGARLIGPNCLGLAVPAAHLNATFAAAPFPAGPLGFVSQSGALGLAVLEEAGERGLGFATFVSIGNKADVSTNDLLEHLEEDPATSTVLLYLESFGNPEKFSRVARRVARSKPIVALKAGTSTAGARAAGSHTAALAGSDSSADALFHQAGVLRVRTLEEFVDAAEVLSTQPLPQGNRVAVVTNAGGLGILCVDACAAAGIELAGLSGRTRDRLRQVLPPEASIANPVDMLGSATADLFAAVVPEVLADPAVDGVIVLFAPPVSATSVEVGAALDRAVETAGRRKPVLGVVMGDTEPRREFARFRYPESAAAALGIACERRRWLDRPAGVPVDPVDADLARVRVAVAGALGGDDTTWLNPRQTWELLAAAGIPAVGQTVAGSVAAAGRAAAALGLPVAVKTARAGAHKSDSGGVVLGVRSQRGVLGAAARIGPPVAIQAMAEPGVELLIGVVRDPVFGPLLACGAGGTDAELVRDVRFTLCPVSDTDAAELVRAGVAGRLLGGYRGRPAADASAVEDVVHRLSWLTAHVPELVELDLNPVIAGRSGCVVVDARARLARPAQHAPAKTW